MNWTEILAIPLVAAIIGLGAWYIRTKRESLNLERQSLLDNRRALYMQVLDPYILLFSNLDNAKAHSNALATLVTPKYRKAMFEIKLLASDQVVSAFNDLMQFFYQARENNESAEPIQALTKWGEFLLAIRRDVGSQTTKLAPLDMLRGEITDIDKHSRQ